MILLDVREIIGKSIGFPLEEQSFAASQVVFRSRHSAIDWRNERERAKACTSNNNRIHQDTYN